MDIHIVTKHDYEVSAGLGKTRWWKISENNAKTAVDNGGKVYLHNGYKQPSFIWGEIIDYNKNEQGRIELIFNPNPSKEQVDWPGTRPFGNPFIVIED